jgi:hypothetical protein
LFSFLPIIKDEISAVQDQNNMLEKQSNQLHQELDDLLAEVTYIKVHVIGDWLQLSKAW